MKVLHIGSIAEKIGGPAFSVYNTITGLIKLGVEAEIVMPRINEDNKLIGTEVPIHFSKLPIDHYFKYTPGLKSFISDCGDFDIYHIQNIWLYNGYAAIDTAHRKEKPYVISPRGSLYPQALNGNSSTFKRWSLRIRLLKDLNAAACIHCTCKDEMLFCRSIGINSPIAIIPNPIEIKEYQKKKDSIFRLGYLGRVHPRKKIEKLIYAWKEIGNNINDAELVIIGSDNAEYEQFLKNEVKRLRLENVRFIGFVSGEKKDEILSSISVLANPSDFENFGNVTLESLVRSIPAIATKGAPWSELITHHCGWWVDSSQENINAAIKDALSTSKENLSEMGKNARKLAEDNYSIDSVANKFKKMYEWCINKGETPDFIQLG